MRGPGRADIVNAGSGESGYSECGGPGRADIVNAGSGESGYSECGVGAYLIQQGLGRQQKKQHKGPISWATMQTAC
ncbi:unnamed protein product [Staurois parvus]|uniref:Uncharacterized protein n=1 Tax=Staurois parvus TaxID=386267 RepID=A0ABN9CS34_9NEOB|nr:unnamed protein product [Staurois parvus]